MSVVVIVVVLKGRNKGRKKGWQEFNQIPFKYSYTIGIRALHLEAGIPLFV